MRIGDRIARAKKERLPAERLGKLDETRRVCVFGFGGKGRELARRLRSLGLDVVVYDRNPAALLSAAHESFETAVSLPVDSTVPILLGSGQQQVEQKNTAGARYVYYQEACHVFDLPYLFNRYREFSGFVVEHVGEFEELLGKLDPTSARWFDVPQKYGVRAYKTFLDVGAYDGDTLASAKKWLGTERAIALEANAALLPKLDAAAEAYARGVDIHLAAAWSHKTALSFDDVSGGMIRVRESATGDLPADAMDNLVRETSDLVKMDIEGAEGQALAGAKRVLAEGADWAIAAYHRPEDVLRLPSVLQEGLTGEYGVMFRHYSEVFDDSIFYFLRARRAGKPKG